MTRLLWLLLAALLITGLSAWPAAAQVPGQFATVLQATQSALDSVQAALRATNVSAARANLSAAQGSLQTARSALQSIESQATDDATRSRASGLLGHVNAALASVQAGLTGPDVEVASRADAARGEILETLNEIPPVPSASPSPSPSPSVSPSVSPVPIPTALPPTGSPASSAWLATMAAAGGLFLLSGRLLVHRRSKKLAAAPRVSERSTTQES
ncbi:MAG: hypothetical protein EPO21_16250 [Chloroflexota bacterium]|nr:MAG: hypothetical protein EPO21_16250 [Chloroflexota bacterium]